ncbi:SprT family zinc-dependent metalloprotease [Streptomyces sp. T12]|uniref:M48 family metallopeptidase n=1 Tax=Streptomyces sp. T12 TaxID=477697 RepID=UPI0023659AA4|nr:SprT family zinc-dependent metalloprotease [Streptomyces sp. T12]WDF40669.1 SprT family zinc-dependent metalloprotease [Streptomyces sp. T12]
MPASEPPFLDNAADRSPLVDGQTLVADGRELAVRVSVRRKQLGLTVERDGSLTLRAPADCDPWRAETFVRKSRPWIEGKLRLREQHRPAHPVRAFREGESFRYLGREHRLVLVDEDGAPVRLVAGRFVLDQAVAVEPRRARRELIAWYRKAGLRWAEGRLQPWAARMEVPEPAVTVRDVGNRWGTYRQGEGENGRVALHWAVFQLPSHLVDYVIAHELAHIKIAGHGPDYWTLLKRAIPDCESRKEELDDLGRRLWLGEIRGMGHG